MFVKKGYCRYAGKKCRHMKLQGCIGWCAKSKPKSWESRAFIRNERTGKCKNIPTDKMTVIKAPKWCPKLKR